MERLVERLIEIVGRVLENVIETVGESARECLSAQECERLFKKLPGRLLENCERLLVYERL